MQRNNHDENSSLPSFNSLLSTIGESKEQQLNSCTNWSTPSQAHSLLPYSSSRPSTNYSSTASFIPTITNSNLQQPSSSSSTSSSPIISTLPTVSPIENIQYGNTTSLYDIAREEKRKKPIKFINSFKQIDSPSPSPNQIPTTDITNVTFSMQNQSQPKKRKKTSATSTTLESPSNNSDPCNNTQTTSTTLENTKNSVGMFMEFVGVSAKKKKQYRDIINYKDEFFTDSYSAEKRLRESSTKYRSKQPLNSEATNKSLLEPSNSSTTNSKFVNTPLTEQKK